MQLLSSFLSLCKYKAVCCQHQVDSFKCLSYFHKTFIVVRQEDLTVSKLCIMDQVRASFMAKACLPNIVLQCANE